MADLVLPAHTLNRRRFLRQSFAFSALASVGSLTSIAAPSSPESSDLLLVGDWGYDDPKAQIEVAAGLRAYARKHSVHPRALLMLGDNWYGELAGGASSPRWKSQFEDVYPASDFPCPAYAVLGNHDYQRWPESKVDAELEYAHSGHSRWTMPSRWYRFEFPMKNPLVTFLALDSNMPHASEKPGRDFTLTAGQKAEQLAWLEAELQRPRTTPFLSVMAHHPVYSDGPHGDHAVLVSDWDPLFRKYRVDLFMAGHDHDLQHLEFEGHPTSFFLSGGGGADLYPLRVDPAQRGPYAQKVYGFSHISVNQGMMTLRHLGADGAVLHAFTRTSNGKVTILS